MNTVLRSIFVGLAVAGSLSLAIPSSAHQPDTTPDPFKYITYNANLHPNLSALKGMTEDQIRRLLVQYHNRNTGSPDITDMSGESTSYNFWLPATPPPPSSSPPASAATSGPQPQPQGFKGFMHKFGSDMRAAFKPPPQPRADPDNYWSCWVVFDGPHHTVGGGKCMAVRNPFNGTILGH